MESSGNNSTHEESSKMAGEEDSNPYPNRITRTTMNPQNFFIPKFKRNSSADNQEKDKNNETLPIKGTISTFNFKIVFIGNVAVGKSSIIKRFIFNEFNNQYFCTVGTELSKKSLLIGKNKRVNLHIWDTCGQERFRTVTRQYYHDTQAIILVFDLTNEKTFQDIDSWFQEALNYINNAKCLFFLLGNKSDEKEKIKIDNEQIKQFMRNNQRILRYFEVSAFNGHNIDLVFDKVSQYLIMKFGGEEINRNMKDYKNNLILENKNEEKNKKGGCC